MVAGLSLAACGGGSDGGGDSTGDQTIPGSNNAPGVIDLADLKVGDCISPTDKDLFVSDMEVIDCREPHDMQVAGRFTFAEAVGVEYPGFVAVQQDAYKQCQPAFEQFTGVAFFDSPYDISTVTPSAATWADGDRDTICLIVNIDGAPLVATVQ
jgi:hypothetical protein